MLFEQLLGVLVCVKWVKLVPLLLAVETFVPEVDQLHPGRVDELTDPLRLEHFELVDLLLQFTQLDRGVPLQVPDLGINLILL